MIFIIFSEFNPAQRQSCTNSDSLLQYLASNWFFKLVGDRKQWMRRGKKRRSSENIKFIYSSRFVQLIFAIFLLVHSNCSSWLFPFVRCSMMIHTAQESKIATLDSTLNFFFVHLFPFTAAFPSPFHREWSFFYCKMRESSNSRSFWCCLQLRISCSFHAFGHWMFIFLISFESYNELSGS